MAKGWMIFTLSIYFNLPVTWYVKGYKAVDEKLFGSFISHDAS